MAKRAAPDEQPYRPLLDVGLISAALALTPSEAATRVKEVTLSRSGPKASREPPRPDLGRQNEGKALGRLEVESSSKTLFEREVTPSLVEKLDQEKRILFTWTETQAIDRLVTSLARRLNAQVKVSHVVRALIEILLNAEGEIDKRAGEAPPLVRPPNGDAQALQRFERDIARILALGFRDAPTLRDT